MIRLCTYFDRRYLLKGLALLASLERHMAQPWCIYVLCLDEETWQALYRLAVLPKTRIFPELTVYPIRLDLLEGTYPELWTLKAERSPREYIFTLTAPWILGLIDTQGLPELSYIDADCFLFSSLDPLYAEVADSSIAIIPHRWTPRHAERLQINGVYNVGWLYFRNNEAGLAILRDWRKMSFAYDGPPGTFSDQRLLDSWPYQAKVGDLRVIENIGANVAPWNQERYSFTAPPDGPWLSDPDSSRLEGGILVSTAAPVLFYHFHELRHDSRGVVTYRTGYPLAPDVIRAVYEPYERALQDAARHAYP